MDFYKSHILLSKSPSSYIISTLEPRHHTCHPRLRHALSPTLLEDSNHQREGTLLQFAQILSLAIVLSRSCDQENRTVSQLQTSVRQSTSFCCPIDIKI